MGEETYSLAIMLHEEGLLERCQIFSTDINDRALKKASKGIYNLRDMKKYTENYFAAGGLSEFSKYYHTKYKLAIMSEYLKSNILFIHHDMITEAIFGEMDIILCRNVLIYFTAKLQDRVLLSFHRSLAMGGVLWLGKTENLKYKPLLEKYKILGEKEKIYRKVKA